MRLAPDCALDDEIVTMRPQPAATMSGIADCRQWNVPVRFTASMRSHASSVMSVNVWNSSKPALVTMISIGPSSARTFAIAASTAARSVTSTGDADRARARRLQRRRRPASAASPSRSRSATRLPVGGQALGDGEAHA